MSTTTPPVTPGSEPADDDAAAPAAKPSEKRLNDQQRAFKLYKQRVGESGKPFFPYGVYHDIIAAIVVLLIIIGLSWVWFAQANCDSFWNVNCKTVATPLEQVQYTPGHRGETVWDIKGQSKPLRVKEGDTPPAGAVPHEGGSSPILGPLYEDQADPATTSYKPRPEWYFYFLFYLLILFHYPNLLILGTIGLPTIWLMILIAWPFLDRKKERRPSRRPIAMVSMMGIAVTLLAFTYLGSQHDKQTGPKGISAAQQKLPGFDILFNGKAKGRCTGCHVLGGSGGNIGPGLDNESKSTNHPGQQTLAWQIKHLINPPSQSPGSKMPAKGGVPLTDDEVAQVAAFLLTLGSPEKATDPQIQKASAADVTAAGGSGK